MQHRERDVLLRLGNQAQDALGQQRTHMAHERHQLVQGGEAQLNFVRHPMKSEQRASWSHRHVTLLARRQHLLDNDHRSEQTAQLNREVVEGLTFSLKRGSKKVSIFHHMNERHLAESHRFVAERGRVMFEGQPSLENAKKRKTQAMCGRKQYPRRRGSDGLSKPRPRFFCWARYRRAI